LKLVTKLCSCRLEAVAWLFYAPLSMFLRACAWAFLLLRQDSFFFLSNYTLLNILFIVL
jgi:hypothetical protein